MSREYIVRSCDGNKGLWGIKERFGVNWQKLKDLNPYLKNRKPKYGINVNDVITLPDAISTSPSVPKTTCATCCCSADIIFDTVKETTPSYESTNCGSLAHRKYDTWFNLEPPLSGSTAPYYVLDVYNAAKSAKKLQDMADINRLAEPCSQIFMLWIISLTGVAYKDSKGSIIYELTDPTPQKDFHIVSGRANKDGKAPSMVYSTNGRRPLLGPKPWADWQLKDHWHVEENAITNRLRYIPANALSVALPSSAVPYSGISDGVFVTPSRQHIATDPSKEYLSVHARLSTLETRVYCINIDWLKTYLSI